MPFRKGPNLPTGAEMRILNAVWQLGSATVDEIVNSFPEGQRPNYKTTQAFLRIMENKRFVSHSLRGRAFVYRPRVKRSEVRRSSLRSLLDRYFLGSRSELLVNLLENERIDTTELQELERLIRSYRKAKSSERQNNR